jgi:hypothetical protein
VRSPSRGSPPCTSLIPRFIDPRAGHALLQGFVLGGIARRLTRLRVQRYLRGTVLGLPAVRPATGTERATA